MNSRRHFVKSTALLSSLALLNQSFVPLNELVDPVTKIKATRLKSGDTIAITSPAGAVWDDAQVEKFAGILKGFGFNTVLGNTLKQKLGYFSGTDGERAKELNDFFADKNIKGIFCMKGGWGCARIIDQLDYKLISQNPKVLIGFSDITTLLNAIYAKAGLITFHGPVGNSGWNDYTSLVFKSVIMNAEQTVFPLSPVGEDDKIITFNKGIAKGILAGGNLTIISSLIGSDYLPHWNGKILFLEETKEEPYSIDRMLTQLKLAGVFKQLNGIAIGKFVKCEAEEPLKAFTFMQVLEQHFKPLTIPVFYGLMTGHIENKLTLPVGAEVTMNADTGILKLNESAVL
ncbi:MAG TPA: LD-carboxypeptidase [Bacteroidia bacterium]|jgi:muramoyltetrapeptide carboxypeptidase|nr:LD-carboxypeptidase [Bacteroidia bacterium]